MDIDLVRIFKSRNEDGVAVALVAVFSVVLMAAMALAFDVLITLHVLTKLNAVSEAGALAAMQAFKSSASTDYDTKITEAVARANQVIALNSLQWDTTAAGNPLGSFVAELENCTVLTTAEPCDGGDHSLKFGTLYNSDDGTDPCSGDYPCFITNDYSMGEQPVNAIHAQVQIQPLIALFLQVINQSGMAPIGTGLAVTIPKHYVTAIDLSSSIAWEYHYTANAQCDATCQAHFDAVGPGYYYDSGGGNMLVRSTRTKFAYNKTTVDAVGGQTCSAYLPPDPDLLWGEADYYCGLEEIRPTPAGHTAPWDVTVSGVPYPAIKHYRNDHALVTVNTPGGAEEFYVEQWSQASGAAVLGEGRRVEALSSVLDGAEFARQEFEVRSNPDDLMAIIGFGEEVYDPEAMPTPDVRVASLTNDFDLLSKYLAWDSSSPTWDPTDNAFTRFMFPRPLANTNLRDALEKSYNLLASHPFSEYSANAVILFSDLLGNCTLTGGLYTCNNNYDTWHAAMTQIDTEVIPQFQQSNIPLHIFHVGAHVAPHYLNWKSDDQPGQCQEVAEMIYYENQLINGPCGEAYRPVQCSVPYILATLAQAPFSGATAFGSRWALDTNANYFPIRPVDPTPTCGAGSDEPHAGPGGACRDCTLDPDLYDPADPGTYQMQIYEPENKSIQQQILDGMNQIMGDPYRLGWIPGM